MALDTARQRLELSFDALQRPTEVRATLDQGLPQITRYAYDAVGNRHSQTHPNGTQVAYSYDARHRLKTLLHTTAAGVALLSLSYTVDASGLRTEIAETRPHPTAGQPAITRTTAYTYDAVKRLIREQVSGTQNQTRNTAHTYDAVGNRLTEATTGTINKSHTHTFDANDRLTRTIGTGGTVDHVYDAAGNLIESKQSGTTTARYSFDAEGRLTAATIGLGAAQKTLSYVYDPNGIRRSQRTTDATGASTRTEYLVDPNQAYAQVLEEWDAQAAAGAALPAASLATVYVYGDDLISQTQLALAATTTHIYHYDGLGTTRALSAYNVDTAGNPVTSGPNAHASITDRYAYTAFGEPDPAGTSGNTTGSTDNNYRYTGEQLDPNLGFYYLRARYMDPRSGRFLGMDPFSGHEVNPVTLHRFIYANNIPSTAIDPSGNLAAMVLGGGTYARSASLGSVVPLQMLRAFRMALNIGRAVSATQAHDPPLIDSRLGTRVLPFALELAQSCFRGGTFNQQDCRFSRPTFLVGATTPRHREIVTRAITAGAPPVLTRREPPLGRGWLRCPGSVLGDNLDCDEYPYASCTREGQMASHISS